MSFDVMLLLLLGFQLFLGPHLLGVSCTPRGLTQSEIKADNHLKQLYQTFRQNRLFTQHLMGSEYIQLIKTCLVGSYFCVDQQQQRWPHLLKLLEVWRLREPNEVDDADYLEDCRPPLDHERLAQEEIIIPPELRPLLSTAYMPNADTTTVQHASLLAAFSADIEREVDFDATDDQAHEDHLNKLPPTSATIKHTPSFLSKSFVARKQAELYLLVVHPYYNKDHFPKAFFLSPKTNKPTAPSNWDAFVGHLSKYWPYYIIGIDTVGTRVLPLVPWAYQKVSDYLNWTKSTLPISSTTTTSAGESTATHWATIAAAVLGALALVALIGYGGWLWYLKNHPTSTGDGSKDEDEDEDEEKSKSSSGKKKQKEKAKKSKKTKKKKKSTRESSDKSKNSRSSKVKSAKSNRTSTDGEKATPPTKSPDLIEKSTKSTKSITSMSSGMTHKSTKSPNAASPPVTAAITKPIKSKPSLGGSSAKQEQPQQQPESNGKSQAKSSMQPQVKDGKGTIKPAAKTTKPQAPPPPGTNPLQSTGFTPTGKSSAEEFQTLSTLSETFSSTRNAHAIKEDKKKKSSNKKKSTEPAGAGPTQAGKKSRKKSRKKGRKSVIQQSPLPTSFETSLTGSSSPVESSSMESVEKDTEDQTKKEEKPKQSNSKETHPKSPAQAKKPN